MKQEKTMKVCEFKDLLEKTLKDGNIKDDDEIIIVNGREDVFSDIHGVSFAVFSDDSRKIIIENIY